MNSDLPGFVTWWVKWTIGNFFTFKWQYSGGSACNYMYFWSDSHWWTWKKTVLECLVMWEFTTCMLEWPVQPSAIHHSRVTSVNRPPTPRRRWPLAPWPIQSLLASFAARDLCENWGLQLGVLSCRLLADAAETMASLARKVIFRLP